MVTEHGHRKMILNSGAMHMLLSALKLVGYAHHGTTKKKLRAPPPLPYSYALLNVMTRIISEMGDSIPVHSAWRGPLY